MILRPDSCFTTDVRQKTRRAVGVSIPPTIQVQKLSKFGIRNDAGKSNADPHFFVKLDS